MLNDFRFIKLEKLKDNLKINKKYLNNILKNIVLVRLEVVQLVWYKWGGGFVQ